jgi:hypothetical protein
MSVAFLFACAGCALAQASVTTDQSDYPPGATVTITGSGFQPGETVQLQVLRIDLDENSGPEHDPWPVTADGNGNFQTTWYVTYDEAGATLQLTATGLTSGLTAQTTFTDSATITKPSLNVSADTAATGGTGVYTALGNIVLTEGANRDVGTGNIVLNAPTGFQFNPGATVTMTVTRVAGSSTALTLSSGTATVAANGSTITINVAARDGSGYTTRSSITWAGIQVRPTAGTFSSPNPGNLTKASGGATIAGITAGSTSFGTLTEVAGAATKLAFTTQPGGGTGGTAWTTQPVVTVQDAKGNTVTTDTSTVTVAILNNPGSGTLGGTVTKAAVAGVASFSANALKIDKIGTGYTLGATDGSLTSATSSAFNITTGAATKLVYTTVPSTGTAGTAFSVTVQSQDAGGNPANLASATSITLSKAGGAGTLSGTLTGSIGIGANSVTISTPVYSKSDTMTLTATASGGTALTAVTSGNITFSAGAVMAAQSTVAASPTSVTADGSTTSTVTVTLKDTNSNPVSGKTVTLAKSGGSSTLSAASGPSDVSGVVTFTVRDIVVETTTYTVTDTTNGRCHLYRRDPLV